MGHPACYEAAVTEYVPGGLEDMKLLHWFKRLVDSRDIDHFGVRMTVLSEFFRVMQPPTRLLYEADETGIWAACWAQPTDLDMAVVALWIAEGRRHTKQALHAVLDALGRHLEGVRVLLAVTRQPRIAGEHEKVGFVRLGTVPEIDEGHDATFTYLTRPAYEATRQRLAPALVAA